VITAADVAVAADAALLTVKLPEDAKISINGNETKATGGVRRFVSKGLEEGREYSFVVKLLDDNKPVTKRVSLKAGSRETVSFSEADISTVATSKPLRTTIRLRVPADAKVWIQGKLTATTGEIREFATTKLKQGESWKDYKIRVATVVHDRERVAVRSITLAGGDAVELTIDPSAKPAAETTASK